MKRSVLLAVLAILSLPPAAARAGAVCTTLADASGDVAGPGGAPLGGPVLDALGVDVSAEDATFTATMRVADVDAPLPLGTTRASYQIGWDAGDVAYAARAYRTRQGWTFRATAERAGTRRTLPAEGTVDAAAGTIDLVVPTFDLGPAAPARALRAETRAVPAVDVAVLGTLSIHADVMLVPVAGDTAPDPGAGESPGEGCASSSLWSVPDVTCAVAADPPADARAVAGERDPALEMASLRAAAAERTLVFEIGVADLSGEAPPPLLGNSYFLHFEIQTPDRVETYSLFAYRERGYEYATYSTAKTFGDAAVHFDEAAGAVRVAIRREGIADGTRLRDLRVESASGYAAAEPVDAIEDATFVVGTGCDAGELHACPLVADPAGDAGDWVVRVNDEGVPPGNEPVLDLLAAGASSDAAAIRLSMDVADLAAAPPDGAGTIGWVASWYAGDGMRWAALAERSADGTVRFAYGRVYGSEGYPPATSFEGTLTTGTEDTATGAIAIDVPRAAVGDPADGDVLPGLGAASFQIEARTGFLRGADITEVRPYTVGTDCGAS